MKEGRRGGGHGVRGKKVTEEGMRSKDIRGKEGEKQCCQTHDHTIIWP